MTEWGNLYTIIKVANMKKANIVLLVGLLDLFGSVICLFGSIFYGLSLVCDAIHSTRKKSNKICEVGDHQVKYMSILGDLLSGRDGQPGGAKRQCWLGLKWFL